MKARLEIHEVESFRELSFCLESIARSLREEVEADLDTVAVLGRSAGAPMEGLSMEEIFRMNISPRYVQLTIDRRQQATTNAS